jgi:hypothetical protein
MHSNGDMMEWCDFAPVSKKAGVFKCRRCLGPIVKPADPRRESHRIKRPCTGSPGLGDYVAKAIEFVMPWTKKKKCGGCKKRQELLNAVGRNITG